MTMNERFGLNGKTALITGSTRGIGLAMAEAFVEAGARVIVSSEDTSACAAVSTRLNTAGHDVIGAPCDVRDASALAALADLALSRFGRLDILVCNAGIPGPAGPLASASDAEYADLFNINLRHALRLTSLLAPRMADGGGGSVILTSSIAGLRGNKAVGLYGMSKAALSQLARNLAVEWGPHNVRANAIAPGLIATDWAKNIASDERARERRIALTPLRRFGEPWEIASVAVFLASSGAAFITGQTIVVDGGTLITDGN